MGATAQRMQEAKKNAKRASKRAKLQQDEINGAQWVRCRYDLIRHPKFKQLSGNAVKVFWELMANYTGNNNGALTLTYSSVEDELNISRPSVARSFKELEAHGFIRATRKGNRRLNSLYALTCFKLDEISEPDVFHQGTSKAPDDWKQAP